MRSGSNGEIVERFWSALVEKDFDTAGSLDPRRPRGGLIRSRAR
jgi:hypothetical protein